MIFTAHANGMVTVDRWERFDRIEPAYIARPPGIPATAGSLRISLDAPNWVLKVEATNGGATFLVLREEEGFYELELLQGWWDPPENYVRGDTPPDP